MDDATCRGPGAVDGCQQLDTSTSRVISVNVGSGEVSPLRTEVELRKGMVKIRPGYVQDNSTYICLAGVPLTLDFKITVPENKPINFYYLVDSSSSMVCIASARVMGLKLSF